MDVDPSPKSKKRKNPIGDSVAEFGDPEAPAYNENPKERYKTLQEEAEMQFEDDFEDEFDEEEVVNAMDLEEHPEEEPEDDILPPEEPEVEPEVRLHAFWHFWPSECTVI